MVDSVIHPLNNRGQKYKWVPALTNCHGNMKNIWMGGGGGGGGGGENLLVGLGVPVIIKINELLWSFNKFSHLIL